MSKRFGKRFPVTEVQVFRPYPDEVPWELLAEAPVDEALIREAFERNLLRVGKHEGRVVGSYAIAPHTPLCFELIALVVADGYRRRGVGRWLLGHALGLAETKGAREILARRCAGPAAAVAERFLVRAGFRPDDAQTLRLVLTPE